MKIARERDGRVRWLTQEEREGREEKRKEKKKGDIKNGDE